jgi:hypothetical protein
VNFTNNATQFIPLNDPSVSVQCNVLSINRLFVANNAYQISMPATSVQTHAGLQPLAINAGSWNFAMSADLALYISGDAQVMEAYYDGVPVVNSLSPGSALASPSTLKSVRLSATPGQHVFAARIRGASAGGGGLLLGASTPRQPQLMQTGQTRAGAVIRARTTDPSSSCTTSNCYAYDAPCSSSVRVFKGVVYCPVLDYGCGISSYCELELNPCLLSSATRTYRPCPNATVVGGVAMCGVKKPCLTSCTSGTRVWYQQNYTDDTWTSTLSATSCSGKTDFTGSTNGARWVWPTSCASGAANQDVWIRATFSVGEIARQRRRVETHARVVRRHSEPASGAVACACLDHRGARHHTPPADVPVRVARALRWHAGSCDTCVLTPWVRGAASGSTRAAASSTC